MKHHWWALIAASVSWGLAATGGLLFGHYEHIGAGRGLDWAIGTVTTSGSQFTAVNVTGLWIDGFTKLIAIPVWSFSIALVFSALSAIHVRRAADEIKEHVTNATGGQS